MLRHIESDRITIEMAVAPIARHSQRIRISSVRPVVPALCDVVRDTGHRKRRRSCEPQGGRELGDRVRGQRTAGTSYNDITGARLDTVGRAVGGVDLRVVSLHTGETVATGELGEIQVRSDSAMAGYLPDRRPRKPLRTAGTGPATSDISTPRLAANHRPIEGNDQSTRLSGRARRDRSRPTRPSGSRGLAVFGVPDVADGEAIVAAVKGDGSVDAGELVALVADRLASYKRPSQVKFVDEIPRLPSGKVLRRVLKERLWTSV